MTSKKLIRVQKSNELNQANFSDFSLSCYRVLLNLIGQMQRHDTNGNQLSLDCVSRRCSLSAADYATEFNLDGNTAYEILKEATDKLMKTSFSIKTVQGILKINVCSQAHYIKSGGRIDIEFTPNIMPHLAALANNFTMYNLNEIAGFDSIYTTRFYELLMQFKTTGVLEISVKSLRFHMGCVDKFKQYYDFKKFTFAHAIEEINQQWTLNVKLDEIKTGRTVTDLVFTFERTFTRQAYDPVRQKMRTQLTRPKRKPKQYDDNTPPPAHPNQQELELETSTKKSILKKVVDGGVKVTAKGIAKNPFNKPSVQNAVDNIAEKGLDALNMATVKKYKKERLEEIAKSTPEEIKAIIDIFMKRGMNKTEALNKGIELELIIL
jgi:plasmid replication initiation protein